MRVEVTRDQNLTSLKSPYLGYRPKLVKPRRSHVFDSKENGKRKKTIATDESYKLLYVAYTLFTRQHGYLAQTILRASKDFGIWSKII
jgi:hypothetical protein